MLILMEDTDQVYFRRIIHYFIPQYKSTKKS